jgi:hypothetical protein
MPTDSMGNINPGYGPDSPPYGMGRSEYRKWAKKKRIADKKKLAAPHAPNERK